MIKRTYFYAGNTPVEYGTNKQVSGEVIVTSWFPRKDLYKHCREAVMRHYDIKGDFVLVALNRLK